MFKKKPNLNGLVMNILNKLKRKRGKGKGSFLFSRSLGHRNFWIRVNMQGKEKISKSIQDKANLNSRIGIFGIR